MVGMMGQVAKRKWGSTDPRKLGWRDQEREFRAMRDLRARISLPLGQVYDMETKCLRQAESRGPGKSEPCEN